MNTNPSNPEGADRSLDMLSGILSNPEMLGRIASMLSAVTSASQSTPPRADESERKSATVASESVPVSVESTSNQPNHDDAPSNQGINNGTKEGTSRGMSEGLGGLLSNPAMLENLPQILAVMKPLIAAMPTPKPPDSRSHSPEDCRNNLLLALKPFLSAERCDAIDSIIRISHLGNVFSQLK